MALLRVADGETETIAVGETRSAGPINVEGTLNVAGTLNVGTVSLTATAECGAVGSGSISKAKLLAGTVEAGAVAAATPSEVVPLLRSTDFTLQGRGAVDD